MQIDSTNLGLAQLGQTAQTAATNDASNTKEARGHTRHGHGGDKLQISDLASQLAAQSSASDPQKIEQLKTAYESGKYQVDPLTLAGSIMNDALAA